MEEQDNTVSQSQPISAPKRAAREAEEPAADLALALQPFVLAFVEARNAAARAGVSVAAMVALARNGVDFADFRRAENAYRAHVTEINRIPAPTSDSKHSEGGEPS